MDKNISLDFEIWSEEDRRNSKINEFREEEFLELKNLLKNIINERNYISLEKHLINNNLEINDIKKLIFPLKRINKEKYKKFKKYLKYQKFSKN